MNRKTESTNRYYMLMSTHHIDRYVPRRYNEIMYYNTCIKARRVNYASRYMYVALINPVRSRHMIELI